MMQTVVTLNKGRELRESEHSELGRTKPRSQESTSKLQEQSEQYIQGVGANGFRYSGHYSGTNHLFPLMKDCSELHHHL